MALTRKDIRKREHQYGKKVVLTDTEFELFKNMAQKGETKQAISIALDIDRSTVDRILRQENITLTPSKRNCTGKQYVWTEEKEKKLIKLYSDPNIKVKDIGKYFGCSSGTVCKKAKKMNLKKVSDKGTLYPTDSEIQYLKENNNKKSIETMCKDLGHCDEIILRWISELNLSREEFRRKYTSKIAELYHTDENFKKDIGNPMYSHAYIGRRYGFAVSSVAKFRKRTFGNFKRMVDTFLCKSSAEIDFERILSELKLSYIYEQKIGHWKIDYDLGFNLLIEIQGSYWHDKVQKTMDKDIVKFNELKNLGYTVIEIWDYELKDIEKVKEKILSSLQECIKQYFGSRNLVNLEI